MADFTEDEKITLPDGSFYVKSGTKKKVAVDAVCVFQFRGQRKDYGKINPKG